jgi:hypothetical protein
MCVDGYLSDGGNRMSAPVSDPCGHLDLADADAWAAHAAVEQWLRDAIDRETVDDTRLKRVAMVLERIENEGAFAPDELSLLSDLCRDQLAQSTVPTRDHSALRSVIDAADEQHDNCTT